MDRLVREVAKKQRKDLRVVRAVTHHSFGFLYRKMQNPDCERPIRFRYLGTFVLKDNARKKMKTFIEESPEDNRVLIIKYKTYKLDGEFKTAVICDAIKKGITFTSPKSGDFLCNSDDVLEWKYKRNNHES